MKENYQTGAGILQRYLTPLGAWALAFGCAVGWGSFVMPGSTFLPLAGPLGTVLGIFIGALILVLIGINYHYLVNLYPDAGGAFTYTKKIFGYDHGFLCAWFLVLTYTAIIWANATALTLIGRNLLGDVFQFGFHYQIAGFDIYLGEILISGLALLLGAFICLKNQIAKWVQIIMAFVLIGGITVVFISCWTNHEVGMSTLEPAYAPESTPFKSVVDIIFLAPWAYVGFESISHSVGEFGFSHKRTGRILIISLLTAAFAYAMLAVVAVTVVPEGCSNWHDYISNLGSYSGIEGLPTFFATHSVMGRTGLIILGVTALGGIFTGLIGNYIASSRLLYSMAEDELLPPVFARLGKNNTPFAAILLIMGVSMIIPFFGRTATGWIVDVTTIGAAVAYAYTSAAAFKSAREEGNTLITLSGALGLGISGLILLYFLVPNLLSIDALSTESYLILASWSILGFLVFRMIFVRDTKRRFGHSTIVWIVLLALIYFTSSVWMNQATDKATAEAVEQINEYYMTMLKHEGIDTSTFATSNATSYLEETLAKISATMTRNVLIQTGFVVVALLIIFNIFTILLRREKQTEVEKALAEESSRAKTSFLSNMSHEIRTPMNAIIGLDNIALKDPDLSPRTREQLEKIGASANHLLGLINDILDMSRIESGRMVLKNEDFLMKDFLNQINVIINGQCQDKGLKYECNIIGHVEDYYVGDDMKLKQVLINILGNAVKFTDPPGQVTLTVEQKEIKDGDCIMCFTVKDTGIGMDEEFIPKLFEAFSQEDATSTNRYGGSGLGMAITKNFVEMMGGDIVVTSRKGYGSTFKVTVSLGLSDREMVREDLGTLIKNLYVLVVDDDSVACEHARLVLENVGIKADVCSRSTEAYSKIRQKWDQGEPYNLILTDYRMPVIDGITLTEEIRRFDNNQTAVILMTGYNMDDMLDTAKKEGVDGIISKPLFADSLLREIQAVMRSHKAFADLGETSLEIPEADRFEDKEYDLEGLKVLIAEDVDLNAEILTDILEMEDIESDRAENGKIAVEMFSASKEGDYDAILMDVRMPVMDGLAATEEIRKLDRPDAATIPIIAMTANAFDEDVQNSIRAGMDAHLSKPIDPDLLYETLVSFTRSKTS